MSFDWSKCMYCGKCLGQNNNMQPCLECWTKELKETIEDNIRKSKENL